MKTLGLFVYALFFFGVLHSQEIVSSEIDSLYREDQFYAGVTYNLLSNKPSGLSQNRFSVGAQFGFIRDMPVNKKRNLAVALGLGYAINSYNQNLLINKDVFGQYDYTILNNGSTYTKNRFFNHFIEVPLEFRWRTSTPETYNFWRIYTGVKCGYLFASSSKYEGDLGLLKQKNIKGFNALQYGLTMSVGYSTWNFYLYYALNPLFSNEAKLAGLNDMKTLNVGLMFYIL